MGGITHGHTNLSQQYLLYTLTYVDVIYLVFLLSVLYWLDLQSPIFTYEHV